MWPWTVTVPASVMELLADRNIETEWIQALRDDEHDVVYVVAVGVSAGFAPEVAPQRPALTSERHRLPSSPDEYRRSFDDRD